MNSPSERPRLLVLASTYPRWSGDPEPGFVHELARRLVGRFDVTVICPHAQGAATEEILDGVEVLRFRYAPARYETLVNDGGIVANLRRAAWKWALVPVFALSMAWATLRTLRRRRPQAIHAHWLLPQGLIAAAMCLLYRAAPRLVVTSHGADLFALKAAPLQALKRWVARRASALTVVSAAMREELARIGVDTAKVSVQPMGVDLQGRFTPDPAVARSRHELLFVGRIVEKKGLRHLIDAMPEVIAAHPDAYLTVAGFGPEEAECRKQAARLQLDDRVRFIGPVAQAELPTLYRRAAVFVAPFVVAKSGDQEGLGLVSVEAVGCECPVITSDLPAVRQAFPDPTLVKLVPPGEVKALATAVIANLHDALAAGERAAMLRDDVARRFDWSIVADGYADTLGRVRNTVP